MFYSLWHDLRNGNYKDDFERAVLWFYVQRCGISGQGTLRSIPVGWGYHKTGTLSAASNFHSAIEQIAFVKDRFRDVQIDSRDFADIIETYGHNKRSLIYADPPYIGADAYYDFFERLGSASQNGADFFYWNNSACPVLRLTSSTNFFAISLARAVRALSSGVA